MVISTEVVFGLKFEFGLKNVFGLKQFYGPIIETLYWSEKSELLKIVVSYKLHNWSKNGFESETANWSDILLVPNE